MADGNILFALDALATVWMRLIGTLEDQPRGTGNADVVVIVTKAISSDLFSFTEACHQAIVQIRDTASNATFETELLEDA
jgi:hypothetical protein